MFCEGVSGRGRTKLGRYKIGEPKSAGNKRKKTSNADIGDVEFKTYLYQEVAAFKKCSNCKSRNDHLNCLTSHSVDSLEQLKYTFYAFSSKNATEKLHYNREVISKAVTAHSPEKLSYSYVVYLKDDDEHITEVNTCRACFQVVHRMTKHHFDSCSHLIRTSPSLFATNSDPSARAARAWNQNSIMAGESFESVSKVIWANLYDPMKSMAVVTNELVVHAMAPFNLSSTVAVAFLKDVMRYADQSPETTTVHLGVSVFVCLVLQFLHCSLSYA